MLTALKPNQTLNTGASLLVSACAHRSLISGSICHRYMTRSLSSQEKIPTVKDVQRLIKKYKKRWSESIKPNDDCSKPRWLSPCTIGPNWPLIDREDSISAIIRQLFFRWAIIERDPSLLDKAINPLIACQAVSGGGKSTLMDEFVKLRFDPNEKPKWLVDVPDHLYQRFANYTDETLFIAFTYTKGDRELYSADPDIDTALRILNSYVSASPSFRELQRVQHDLREWECLIFTLQAIMNHYRSCKKLTGPPRLIIIMDEASKKSFSKPVIRTLCSLMDHHNSAWKTIDIIVTTLTDTMLKNALQGSYNRDIKYIPMSPLTSIEKLFPPEKNRNATIVAHHFGGLDRSLYEFNRVLENCPTICDGDLHEAFERIRGNMSLRMPDAKVFEKALLSEELKQSEMDALTYNGAALNGVGITDRIPRVCPFQLYDFSSSAHWSEKYQTALKDLIMLEIKERSRNKNVSPESLQVQFHALWKCMFSSLRGQPKGWSGSLSEFYNDGLYWVPGETKWLLPEFQNMDIVVKNHEMYLHELKEDFWEHFTDSGIHTRMVYKTRDDQPGFDMVQAWQEQSPESDSNCLVVEFTDFKSGIAQGSKPLTHAELLEKVDEKRELMDQQLTKLVKQGILGNNYIGKPFYIHRDNFRARFTADASYIKPVLVLAVDCNFETLPDYHSWLDSRPRDRFPVAILSRDGMQRAYGPSLTNLIHLRPKIAALL